MPHFSADRHIVWAGIKSAAKSFAPLLAYILISCCWLHRVDNSHQRLSATLTASDLANENTHKAVVANLTSLSGTLAAYQEKVRLRVAHLDTLLSRVDSELDRVRVDVGGVQRQSHEHLSDTVEDEMDRLSQALQGAILRDRCDEWTLDLFLFLDVCTHAWIQMNSDARRAYIFVHA